MTDKLKLGKGFSITIEQMLQRWAILGMSGAGKSNTAVVMVEEMYRLGIPFVVIDPKGDWWGVRSSKTGKSGGLDIPIFGGEHGDIPLYADGGAVMADAVAAQEAFTQSIIDVSQFEDHELLRFLMDFADRIYKVNRLLIILVLEEADEYIPQNKESPEQAKSVGKWSRIVKRGRTRGLLTVLVALRNSELAKSVLNFSDSVVVHRATAKLDREAVKGWVEYSGASKEILDSMPTLDDGEVWVSSPQKLKLTKRLRIFRRHTFDSGATPDLDTDRARVTMKEVDLTAIAERMKDTIERAKAEDPKELRKTIAGLEKQLREQPVPEAPEPFPVEVAIPVLDEDYLAEVTLAVDDLRELARPMPELVSTLVAVADNVRSQIDRAEGLLEGSSELPPGAPSGYPSAPNPPGAPAPVSAPRSQPPPRPRSDTPGDATDLQPSEQKLLDAVMWWYQLGQHAPTKQMVAIIAGYAAGKKIGGRLGNLFSALRTRGLIDYPGPGTAALTADGHAAARPPEFEATTAAIQAAVMSHLDPSEAKLLQAVIDHYPSPVDKREAAAEAGYAVADKIGGRVGNLFGKLRSLGFIDYPSPGDAVAMPVLFLEGR